MRFCKAATLHCGREVLHSWKTILFGLLGVLATELFLLQLPAQASDQDVMEPAAGRLQHLTDVTCFKSYESLLQTNALCPEVCFQSQASMWWDMLCSTQYLSPVVQSDIPVPTVSQITQAEVILLRAHQIQHFWQEREYLLQAQARHTRKSPKPRT